MLVLSIDDVFDSAVEVVQDALRLYVSLLERFPLILLVLLSAAGSLGEVILCSQLLGALLQRSFKQLAWRVPSRGICRQRPSRPILAVSEIGLDGVTAEAIRQRLTSRRRSLKRRKPIVLLVFRVLEATTVCVHRELLVQYKEMCW